MLIAEIIDLQKIVNTNKDDAVKHQAKQLNIKRAKLKVDKAAQRAVSAQQRLRKAQTS